MKQNAVHELRNSSVEWIGELPEHWKVVKIKWVAQMESGHTPNKQIPENWIDCTIPWVSLSDTKQLARTDYITDTEQFISHAGIRNSSAHILPPGVVVFTRDATIGLSAITTRPMAVSQHVIAWVCGRKLIPEYLLRVFYSMRGELDKRTMGATVKTIGMPDVRTLTTPLPPLATQRAIANFLDRKTAAIDRLIAAKERLLALLAEKRQALITRAVTRGLDPNVPLKDSGIPWLGKIPKHWEALKLKYVLQRMEQGWSPLCESRLAEEDEWGVLKAGCVNGAEFDEKQHKALPSSLDPIETYEVRPGDVLMSRASGSRECIGSAGIVRSTRSKLLLCDKLYRLLFLPQRCMPEYAVIALRSYPARLQIDSTATGASTLRNISQEFVQNMMLAWPPLAEQETIANSVGEETRLIDEGCMSMQRSISILHEYRQTLISAAVTGKIDVRGDGGEEEVAV